MLAYGQTTMNGQEQKDLDELNERILAKRSLLFSYMKHLSRLNNTELALCGHQNGVADALLVTLLDSLNR